MQATTECLKRRGYGASYQQVGPHLLCTHRNAFIRCGAYAIKERYIFVNNSVHVLTVILAVIDLSNGAQGICIKEYRM